MKNADSHVSIKPAKKYQIDTPICSVAALSETHFALASVGDGKIKLFDSSTKTINTYPAHSGPITFLTKIRAVFSGDQVNPTPKFDDQNSRKGFDCFSFSWFDGFTSPAWLLKTYSAILVFQIKWIHSNSSSHPWHARWITYCHRWQSWWSVDLELSWIAISLSYPR